MLSVLVGCQQKKYEKSPSAEVVDQLNARDYDAVIARIDPATTDTQQKFYLASAYAGRGMLDVFVLFPLLEMYLFNRPAMEWDDLSEVKDPYRRFLRRLNRRGAGDRQSRQELENEYVQRLRLRHKMDEEFPACPGVPAERIEVFRNEELRIVLIWEQAIRSDENIAYIYPIYPEGEWRQYENGVWRNRSQAETDCSFAYWERLNNRYQYYYALADAGVGRVDQEQDQAAPGGDSAPVQISAARAQNLVMEGLWHTYEAIPFLERLPVVPLAAHDDLTRAINLMMEVRQDPRLRERAEQSVVAWSLVSILSIYRTGFDITRSDTMKEMFCGFSLARVIDFYPVIRTRFRTLLDLYEVSEESSRTRNQLNGYFTQADQFLSESPEHLAEDVRAYQLDQFRDYQLRHCIDGG